MRKHLNIVAWSLAIGLVGAAASPALGDAGAIKWEKRGAASGQALVFLPGVGFAGNVWQKIYSGLEKDHPVYVVTYAGAAGVPPIKPPYLDQTIDAVKDLIDAEKLNKPVLVGHLIGGHIALRVAGQYPDRVGGVVCVPVMAHRPAPEQRAAESVRIRESYEKIPADMWEPELRVQVRSNIEAPEVVDELSKVLGKSDRATYAGLVGEMFADNIEQWLPKIKVPVQLVAALDSPASAEEIALRDMRMAEYVRNVQDGLRGLFPELERCDIHIIRYARVFVMYEQPERFGFALNRYLKKLADPNARWQTTRGGSVAPTSPELAPTSRAAPTVERGG